MNNVYEIFPKGRRIKINLLDGDFDTIGRVQRVDLDHSGALILIKDGVVIMVYAHGTWKEFRFIEGAF